LQGDNRSLDNASNDSLVVDIIINLYQQLVFEVREFYANVI